MHAGADTAAGQTAAAAQDLPCPRPRKALPAHRRDPPAAAGALSSPARHAGRRDVPARAGYALLRRVLHVRQSCRQPDAAQCRDVRAEHARAVRDDAAGVMNFTEALLFSGFAHTMLCAYQL